MTRNSYRLPSGKYSKSAEYYIRAWHKIYKHAKILFGPTARVISCDPGVSISLDGPGSRTLSIPVDVMKRLNALHEENIKLKKENVDYAIARGTLIRNKAVSNNNQPTRLVFVSDA